MSESELEVYDVRIRTLEREIGTLNKIVITGDGKQSLMQQVATLETQLKAVSDSIAELRNSMAGTRKIAVAILLAVLAPVAERVITYFMK